MGILFKKKGQTKVTCYIDVLLAGDAKSLRSCEGYVFQLGARKNNKLLFFHPLDQSIRLSHKGQRNLSV